MFLQYQLLQISYPSAAESSMPYPALRGSCHEACSDLRTFREIYNIQVTFPNPIEDNGVIVNHEDNTTMFSEENSEIKITQHRYRHQVVSKGFNKHDFINVLVSRDSHSAKTQYLTFTFISEGDGFL